MLGIAGIDLPTEPKIPQGRSGVTHGGDTVHTTYNPVANRQISVVNSCLITFITYFIPHPHRNQMDLHPIEMPNQY